MDYVSDAVAESTTFGLGLTFASLTARTADCRCRHCHQQAEA